MEISGTVEAVGSDVAGSCAGTAGRRAPDLRRPRRESLCRPRRECFRCRRAWIGSRPRPSRSTFLTAWYACHRAQVAAGERVVVTAAAGGVGTALLQLLRERGAVVVALVGSEREALPRVGSSEPRRPACMARQGSSSTGLSTAIRTWCSTPWAAGCSRGCGGGSDAGGRYVLYGFAAASGARGVAKWTAARELFGMGLPLAVPGDPVVPDADRLQPLASSGPLRRAAPRARRKSSTHGARGRIRPDPRAAVRLRASSRGASGAREPRDDRQGRRHRALKKKGGVRHDPD